MATAPKLVYAHIVKRPEYCFGQAAIDHTRIRVNNVVFLHKQGRTDEEILVEYPDLTRAQVHAALAYYYDHVDEIEAELEWDRTSGERYERDKAEALAHRYGR